MPRKENASAPANAQAQQDLVSEGIENYELPRALVTRIAKSALPENVKMQKDTVLSLVKGSTVFINYLAATAHEISQNKQHKSISASDVLKALEVIEFGDLVPRLQIELTAYREDIKQKRLLAQQRAQQQQPHGQPHPHSTSAPAQGPSHPNAKPRAKPYKPYPDAIPIPVPPKQHDQVPGAAAQVQAGNGKGKERAVPVSAPVHTQQLGGPGSASAMTDMSEVAGRYDVERVDEGMNDEEDEGEVEDEEQDEDGEDEEEEGDEEADEPEAEEDDERVFDVDEADGGVAHTFGGRGAGMGHDSMDVDVDED